jgi:nucleotidyltransferase/DNA polymerase involved in DNA repair
VIACVFLPDLVARALEPSPAIARDVLCVTPTGFVQAASRGAARRGVQVGMRVRQAHALCPAAAIRLFDEAPFVDLGEAVETALSTFTTRMEAVSGFGYVGKRKKLEHALLPASTACYYLDLGKLRGSDALVLARHMQAVLSQTLALVSTIGLSRGKFPALVASRVAQPDQPKLILPGEEGRFLAPFPVSLLPLDRDASRRLGVFGIQTLGALAQLPRGAVLAQFGRDGRQLHALAQGNDPRPVIARPHKPSERLREALDGAVDNRLVLAALLEQMGCAFEQRLAAQGYTTRSVELILHLGNGKTLKSRRVLREPIQDGRLIGRQLIRLLAGLALPCGVVGVEAAARDLAAPVMQQLDLFAHPSPTASRLSDLLETFAARFGTEHLFRVTDLDPDHWLVEERFVLEPVDAA